MGLIDKDAALAEIKKLEKLYCYDSVTTGGRVAKSVFISINDVFNSLEVKEVDLEEEIEKCLKKHGMLAVGKKDFTDIAKHFFELGLKTQKGEQVDYGKLKTSLDDALSKETKESWEKFLQEEQVSEELEEAAIQFATDTETGKVDVVKQGSFFWGAQWKEQQYEKNRLKHCDALTEEQAQMESDFVVQHLKKNNRTPTFIDAIEYGMSLQKQQMMAKAINTEASYTMSVPCICISLPLGVKVGDKVKVIVIKEADL